MRKIRVLALVVITSAATAALLAFSDLAGASRAATDDIGFRGNGGKTLAPFTVGRPSTLRWTAKGGIFQIFNQGLSRGGDVNSQASSGATYMPPGHYKLQVNAIGDWTIKIVPGIERPRSFGGGRIGFQGNGGRLLPPFTTRRGTTLFWQAGGGIFQLFAEGLNGPDVNSQAARGTTYMEAGRHLVTVHALGSWKLWWKP